MAKHILVANWKNHPDSLSAAKALLTNLAKKKDLYKKTLFFIAPPYPYFEAVSVRSSLAHLASQDISAFSGTHTSAVTPDILKNFGVKLSIIGHSERRAGGESNEVVNQKIKVALKSGIMPLLCVGERERDRDGNHFTFVREQLKSAFHDINKNQVTGKVIVAYEPVWAIGKNADEAMQPADVHEMNIFIKKVLSDIWNHKTAESIPVLYGGSVEADNASAIAKTGMKGFLVGHASLDYKGFAKIAESLI